MTHNEADIELFKKEARRIYSLCAPIIPVGQLKGVDADKYTEFRNNIQDKVLESLNAQDIPTEIKISIIAELEDELNITVNKNIQRQ
jgi:hypothetical protein